MSFFKAKVVWVTGASSGIGEELSIQLAAKGARLILSARNMDKLEGLAARLEGDGHIVLPTDLSKTDTIPNLVEKALSLTNQKIDVLINNAGVSQRSLAEDMTEGVYRALMEINYFAVVALTSSILPSMKKNKQGKIVTISSVAGKIGAKFRSGYSGAKHAVIGFTDCIRAENMDKGISVLNVCPGYIKTNISKNAFAGNGTKYDQNDMDIENGISVESCAKKIINAIESGEDEIVIAKTKERMAVFFRNIFPSIVFKLSSKIKLKK